MTTIQTVVAALELISALGLIAVVMMQESEQGGMGVISGGADTFFGKTGGNPRSVMLRKATIGLGLVFVVLTMTMVFLVK